MSVWLPRTGEREVPAEIGTLEGICPVHIQRYEFAAMWTDGKRVCDAACGVGYGAALLHAAEYVGYDYDPETIRFAQESYGGKGRWFVVADAMALPHTVKPFDVVVSFETIEHIDKPELFLSRAATNGDLLIASTPAAGACNHSPYHAREYSLQEFYVLLCEYWREVEIFAQVDGRIVWPARDGDGGNLVAVCR
jgi:O-antigen biosynthesis protein